MYDRPDEKRCKPIDHFNSLVIPITQIDIKRSFILKSVLEFLVLPTCQMDTDVLADRYT